MKVYNIEPKVLFANLASVALKGHKGELIMEIYPELDLVTTVEAMELLDVTLPTLDRYRTKYNLKSFKGGRRVFYKSDDIQQLIAQADEEGKTVKYRRINNE